MGCGSSANNRPKKFRKSVVDLTPSLETCRYDMKCLDDDYQCTKELGSGLSGPVLLATHKETGEKVAVKGLKKNDYYEGKIMLNGEVKVYLHVDHPNIARLLQVFEDEDYVYLVMEFCGGGSLHQRLTKKIAEKGPGPNPSFPENVCAGITRQMLFALNYCHEHGIVHRDLKLENWVFEGTSFESRLKLIDFGFARFCEPDTKMSRLCGSAPYASPELLNGSYTMKAEMWALGVIVYMLLVGYPPFHGSTQEELFAKIRLGKFMPMTEKRWSVISQTGKDFACSLLQKDVSSRLSSKHALQHAWLRRTIPRPSLRSDVWELMVAFSQYSRFRRCALRVLAYFIPPTMMKEAGLAELFTKLAPSPRGTLTCDELVEALKLLADEGGCEPVSTEYAKQVFSAMDIRQCGEVMYSDWMSAVMLAKGSRLAGSNTAPLIPVTPELYKLLFMRLADSSSTAAKITPATLENVFGNTIPPQDLVDMMADEEGGGKSLDFDSYTRTLVDATR